MSGQSNSNIRQGALFGAGAYLLSLVTAILAVTLGAPDEMKFYQDVRGGKRYIFAQFNIHELNLLTGGEVSAGVLLWTVVTAIILLFVGFAVASGVNIGSGDAFRQGVSITIGYFLVTILAVVYLFIQPYNPDLVDLLIWLVVTGIVYPVVFGGIGGIIAENTR
ncbi:hypothetical protein [Halovenus marina]|uniref:hypothetical protein n=1 Tax=Halovenus marina TaxID=3396621 RepID=UPI003F56912A